MSLPSMNLQKIIPSKKKKNTENSANNYQMVLSLKIYILYSIERLFLFLIIIKRRFQHDNNEKINN